MPNHSDGREGRRELSSFQVFLLQIQIFYVLLLCTLLTHFPFLSNQKVKQDDNDNF